jgi:transcriptional regulator with XRE-family HTH domain
MNPPAGRTGVPSTEARIGEVIKRLREKRGLSLRTLATRVDFSASFLSQLENGQVSPSIASLERIVTELGVTLADLFEASQKPGARVVRAEARLGFTSEWSRARVESLSSAGGRSQLEAIAVTLEPRGASGKHPTRHAVDHFAYMLKGALILVLDDERLELSAGDCLVIPATAAHRWVNTSSESSEVLLVFPRPRGNLPAR